MSHAHAHASSSSSTNFQLVINNALDEYKKRTKNDLITHPLAAQLQSCNSPHAILAVLHQQVQELDQPRSSDERWSRWLGPTVNVIYVLSSTLAAGVSLVFSPANVIFAGVGILLSAAKDARASQDTLVEIFERIEMFFRRLEIYTELPSTMDMMDIITQIMAEVLSILGIATKEIRQGQMKKYAKKLIGRTEMEDALKRLDKLTQEEARMAAAQNLKVTHTVDERVKGVADTVEAIDNRVAGVDDRVASVGGQMSGVSDQVADVSDQVAGVRDQVADVNDQVAGTNHQVAGVSKLVSSVDDRVAAVGNQVSSVEDRVARVNDRVVTVDDRVKMVDSRVIEVIADVQQTANDVVEMKRNQFRKSIRKWLSPPDPSTNHNIACSTHRKKTATWFFEGSIFQEWKSAGSLLWIHGKPGSGKSVICSTVIEDIEEMCKAENASMAYFYFDFRDANKQGPRDLVTSLLTQLSASSGPHCDILSDLYLAHDEGDKQPSIRILAKCLNEMLTLPDQHPTYLIIDALDESSNTSGIPSPRETVLLLLKEIVDLSLPNLHICVTSRPEIDIRNVLEPLASRRVSLHDQRGQNKDIADYVRSVVYSDSEQIMRRWKTEDKELVIETLAERADGMFRWVFCQLETLRHCLPPSVRRTLYELPESLDETYERVLKEIKRPNRDHAYHLLQCLVVAIRPLEVKELAEVLAVDFDDAEGIPKLKPDWRWEDEEQAILTSCSSLITTVQTDDSRIVQFSHFSVKEYLTSERLATSIVSRYHIDLEPAHTIMAQACLGILLQPEDCIEENGIGKKSPLARYAAEYWVNHAQFERVSSFVRKAMKYLFDPDMPYFAAWLQLHDIDISPKEPFKDFSVSWTSGVNPLYYSALCGFQDLVEHLVAKYPQHVSTSGGNYGKPIVAALAGRHFQTASHLLQNGAHVDVRHNCGATSLHHAVWYGDLGMVQLLLDYKADASARTPKNYTPIHDLPLGSQFIHLPHHSLQMLGDIARLLLVHGVDVNAQGNGGHTPLHMAAEWGQVEVGRVLLEHGANVGVEDDEGATPLHAGGSGPGTHFVTNYEKPEVLRMLLEHGANVGAKDNQGRTPLHAAAGYEHEVYPERADPAEVLRVLLEHGANVSAKDNQGRTPLHAAAQRGRVEVVRMLLEHGAYVGTEDNQGGTPLHAAADYGSVDADEGGVEEDEGSLQVVRVLLEHGANVGAEDNQGRTAFQIASAKRYDKIMRLLSEHGAKGVL